MQEWVEPRIIGAIFPNSASGGPDLRAPKPAIGARNAKICYDLRNAPAAEPATGRAFRGESGMRTVFQFSSAQGWLPCAFSSIPRPTVAWGQFSASFASRFVRVNRKVVPGISSGLRQRGAEWSGSEHGVGNTPRGGLQQ